VLFNGINYRDWFSRMRLHMRGLHLWEFLMDELPCPPSPSAPTQPVISEKTTTAEKERLIASVKARLSDQFFMSDLGRLRYFLGIEISSTPEGFFLSQEKYIQDLLDRASLIDHRTAETPMELNVHLAPTDDEPLEDPTHYRHIVGSLVYLGVTRLDISYSIHILSQFVSTPTL
jgi:hypothetical protein